MKSAFADSRYRIVPSAKQDVFAWGSLVSADFGEKTLEFRIDGNMPRVAAGRYAIIEADKLRMLVMQANLWREQAEKSA